MTSATAAATASELTVRYDGNLALCKATFTIPRGRLTAIIGPNGSGKSTLLKTLSGLEDPDHGQLEVLGRTRGRTGEVAHVMQTTEINEAVPLTVLEVVTMGRYAHRGMWSRLTGTDRRIVRRSMERLDVTGLAHRHLRELSGGQRQRVYIAQGLAQEADLLLLDEPVTGLDLVTLERIRDVLNEEVDAGRTVVLTTHDVATAAEADHVILLATDVIATGPPDEVLTTDHLQRAYGGTIAEVAGALVIGDAHHHDSGVVHTHEHPDR